MPFDEAERAVGPLVVGAVDGLEPRDVTRSLLEAGCLGGVTLFRRNVACELDVLARLNAALHALAPRGIVVAIDQEGGRVARLRFAPVIQLPAARELAAAHPEATLERVGFEVGRQLLALGFTMNFAPVLDVHSEPTNPVIGDRAFGVTPADASRAALAFARGQRRAGLASCGKHFPGHGDTTTDSHLALPVVEAPLDVLRTREFEPFRAAAAAGLEAFMSAHVVYRALAPLPSTLAPAIATRLLRDELGFDGVLFSDDLRMKALSDDVGANAVSALTAGCDAVLVCEGEELVRDVVATLAGEYRASEAFRARVAQARRRVDRMVAGAPAAPVVDAAELRAQLDDANRAAVRLLAELEP
jgi:beta-N-acetylhexosaminidase